MVGGFPEALGQGPSWCRHQSRLAQLESRAGLKTLEQALERGVLTLSGSLGAGPSRGTPGAGANTFWTGDTRCWG